MSSDIYTQLKQIQEQLQDERRLREQAESRAEQQEKQTRRTTFEELLESCHHLSKSISVQTAKSLSTQGSTTSPKGKRCPKKLRPWEEFPSIQQRTFDTVYNVLHPPNDASPRLFSPVLHIEELGRTMPRRKIASEDDLRLFQHSAVENFVADIISVLARNHQCREDLALGQGVIFENHTNTLNDLAEDVQALVHSSTFLSKSRPAARPIHADQICVYKNEDSQMELLFIIEYKAPHKLTKEFVRAGLRPMDVPKEVIHRPTIPTDLHEKFNYSADRLVAAAAAQVYSYMLESGTEYSCIITGEAIIFLWIKEDDSNALYYHLAEPNEEVYTGDGFGFQHPLTAISQLLTFCLMAFRSKRRSQLWRETSMEEAYIWSDDLEEILRNMSPEERKLDPPSSTFKARKYPINERSPYQMRRRVPKSYRSGCSLGNAPTREDRDDPAEGSGDGSESISTPSKRGRPSGNHGDDRRRGTQESSSSGNQRRPYCTQGCLLGLVRGTTLDTNCPNAKLHRQGKKGRGHVLSKQYFSTLVQQQLATTLDANCTDLKKQGARGALFQITLASHGYTFVGKGTRDVFVPDLKHEGRMYDRLESVQGKMIPVYLGNIDLKRPWRDFGVRIIHMLLMSWGGERVDQVEGVRNLEIEVKRFEGKLARLGVRHEDLRPPNMLWNKEMDRVLFIDFERATEMYMTALQELSTNRKRKQIFDDSRDPAAKGLIVN